MLFRRLLLWLPWWFWVPPCRPARSERLPARVAFCRRWPCCCFGEDDGLEDEHGLDRLRPPPLLGFRIRDDRLPLGAERPVWWRRRRNPPLVARCPIAFAARRRGRLFATAVAATLFIVFCVVWIGFCGIPTTGRGGAGRGGAERAAFDWVGVCAKWQQTVPGKMCLVCVLGGLLRFRFRRVVFVLLSIPRVCDAMWCTLPYSGDGLCCSVVALYCIVLYRIVSYRI
mmetsp:Transcript_7071/g.14441  ORF Transcript_7071/g.14441 Transcript_7071/m.14441 type:complete len:227 (+) Transcript_7071:1459-2139(+)